jgi:hypothetical protein
MSIFKEPKTPWMFHSISHPPPRHNSFHPACHIIFKYEVQANTTCSIREKQYVIYVLKTQLHLIFVVPCIFNVFPKCNQQDATFLNLFISIKRSTCFRQFLRPSSGAQTTYSFWYLSNLTAATCCYHGWDETSSIPTMMAWGSSSEVWQIPEVVCTVWAPDDGWRNRLKHVEHVTEINKLRNVAYCWLHFGNTQLHLSIQNLCLLPEVKSFRHW